MTDGIIKSLSLYGLIAVFLYVGLELYDKTPAFSIIFLMFGLILVIHVTLTEMRIIKEKHDQSIGRIR